MLNAVNFMYKLHILTEFIKEINSIGTKMFRINQKKWEQVGSGSIWICFLHEMFLDTDPGKGSRKKSSFFSGQSTKRRVRGCALRKKELFRKMFILFYFVAALLTTKPRGGGG